MDRLLSKRLAVAAAAAGISAALFFGCSGDRSLSLAEEIHGFRLGETFEDFTRHSGLRVNWTQIPARAGDPRGLMLMTTGTPDRDREIERARLTFFEDRLMEVVVYYRSSSVRQMNILKARLEDRYQTKATSPDGSIETTYKTYRLKGAGISISLRRITKKAGTELYVQYLHDELHGRFKSSQEDR